ncbi:MAG: phosphoribosylanthranilate isomerase [Chloroflexota bacterium]|nr:phosphoribosylanthranilate isomerase [Chloroflexota bacterium]
MSQVTTTGTLVKICGLRSLPEARAAVQAGADLLGFIFWKPGKRYIAPADAARIIQTLRAESSHCSTVGVFVDPTVESVAEVTAECGLDYVQLSGQETRATVEAMPRPTLKAIHVRPGGEAAAAELVASDRLGARWYLLDTHADGLPGGTGSMFDWSALRAVGPHCFVAGGLRPDNVATALATLGPVGVDVSSGVEFSKTESPTGGKDPALIRAFLEAVRTYDHRQP